MKKVLFLTRTLGLAGVANSLIPILDNIDYEKFNLTLGVQYPVKSLENEVNANVKIVYYGEIQSKTYKLIYDFNKKLSIKKHGFFDTFLWHLLNKLENFRMVYKIHKCFNIKYDTAVAYHQGIASKFVIQHIRAKKKILWYHSSIIEYNWYQKIFEKADKIITVSENARKVMIKEWGNTFEDKIISLHCLIPVDKILSKATIDIGLPKKCKDEVIILSCGRLSREKGMDLAIKAAKIIKKNLPELKFKWILVGDGSEREMLEKLILSLELENNIILAGRQSNPYPFFKMCDIYVQPSRLESFGLSIAEALVLQCTVITTKTAGGTEQINNLKNGIVCEINEVEIAKQIIRLIKDESLYQSIKYVLSNKNFSQEEIIKTINYILN